MTISSSTTITTISLRTHAYYLLPFCSNNTVGSALVFHLPPAAPPILFLALIPSRTTMKQLASTANAAVTTIIDPTASTATISSNMLQRISIPNSLARKVAWITMGMTILSWADYEIGKKRRLTPLPVLASFSSFRHGGGGGSNSGGSGTRTSHHEILDVRKVTVNDLPPFLPEALPPLEEDPILFNTVSNNDTINNADMPEEELLQENKQETGEDDDHSLSHNMKRNLSRWYKTAASQPETLTSMAQSWKRMNRLRQREQEDTKRNEIIQELKSLQRMRIRWNRIKKTQSGARARYFRSTRTYPGKDQSTTLGLEGADETSSPPMGYALVTGASRGIGRALAVELARWEVPLVLVARDMKRLTSLSKELEECYGIHCCAIEADLSKPATAKKLYETTKEAGIRVDILVNNAGACSQGTMVEDSEEEIQRMIDINVGSVTTLSHLYGRDMKENRRGRILFLSSITGAAASGPTIATYAATKAYEKSLALSLGKEMEPFGVGVTCIMPGATKTNFASNSQLEDAICFKTPFYPMKAKDVASRGIRALLSGDAEVVPGWHNRAFVKLVTPLIPQRCSAAIVEFFFNPLEFRIPLASWLKVTHPLPVHNEMKKVYNGGPPPRILKLPSTAPTNISRDSNESQQNDDTNNPNETNTDDIVPTGNDASNVEGSQNAEKDSHL